MIPMREGGFKYYALHYLNLWKSQDEPCHLALKGKNLNTKLKALAKAAADYGIARTLPKRYKTDQAPARYGPLLRIINRQKPADFRHLRPDELVQRITSVNRQIVLQYKSDHQLLSLTTKFLWLKMKSPIIIFDGRAKEALRRIFDRGARKVLPGAPHDFIGEYYRLWREEFERCEQRIGDACASLKGVHEFADPKIRTLGDISKVAGQHWFRERVFDVYLWRIGEGAESTD